MFSLESLDNVDSNPGGGFRTADAVDGGFGIVVATAENPGGGAFFVAVVVDDVVVVVVVVAVVVAAAVVAVAAAAVVFAISAVDLVVARVDDGAAAGLAPM